jgi:hypothetical protein
VRFLLAGKKTRERCAYYRLAAQGDAELAVDRHGLGLHRVLGEVKGNGRAATGLNPYHAGDDQWWSEADGGVLGVPDEQALRQQPAYLESHGAGQGVAAEGAEDTTADSGTIPPPSALPSTWMSGWTSSCWQAKVRPVLPSPDWISSVISRMPAWVQMSRISRRYPGGGTITPASPWMGSTRKATVSSSIASRRASASAKLMTWNPGVGP